jgi:excisionase family DNA binding protein
MEILTTKQVAALLQTSGDTVELLIKRGELKAERLTPRGRYRIIKKSVIEYADRNQIALKQPQPTE